MYICHVFFLQLEAKLNTLGLHSVVEFTSESLDQRFSASPISTAAGLMASLVFVYIAKKFFFGLDCK